MATPNTRLQNARQAILNQGGKLKEGTPAPTSQGIGQPTAKAKEIVKTKQAQAGVSYEPKAPSQPKTPVLDTTKVYVMDAFDKNSDYKKFMAQDNTVKYKTIYGANGIYTAVYDQGTGKMFDINSAKGKEVLGTYGVNPDDIAGKTNLFSNNTFVDKETGMSGDMHSMYTMDVQDYLKGLQNGGVSVADQEAMVFDQKPPELTAKAIEKQERAELNMYGTDADKLKAKQVKANTAQAGLATTGNVVDSLGMDLGQGIEPEQVLKAGVSPTMEGRQMARATLPDRVNDFGYWLGDKGAGVMNTIDNTGVALGDALSGAGNAMANSKALPFVPAMAGAMAGNPLPLIKQGIKGLVGAGQQEGVPASFDPATQTPQTATAPAGKPASTGGVRTSQVAQPAVPSPEDMYMQDREMAIVKYGGIENLPEYTYTQPKELDVNKALKDMDNMSFGELKNFLNTTVSGDLSGVPSAQINTALMANLGLTTTENNYKALQATYSNAEQKAKEAYANASLNIANTQAEIDSIIKGKTSTATSFEGLSALIATQNKDLGMMSVQAMEDRLNAEYKFTFDEMVEQNSRLEGYMKAKLNFQGASASSEALSMMAHTIDKAQQRLMLYNTQYTSEMVNLEVNKRQILNDFYNGVNSTLIDLSSQKSSALSQYTSKLDEVANNRILSDMEMETEKFSLLNQFTSQISSLQEQAEAKNRELANEAYGRSLNEFQIVNSLEQQQMDRLEQNFGMLLEAYAGKTLDELPQEVQKAMFNATQALGLPIEFARQSLASIKSQLMQASVGRGGGGGGAGLDLTAEDRAWYRMGQDVLQNRGGDGITEADALLTAGFGEANIRNYYEAKEKVEALQANMPQETTTVPASFEAPQQPPAGSWNLMESIKNLVT